VLQHLDGISEEEIVELNIPTGLPLVYTLDDNLKPIKMEGAAPLLSGRYLGDAEEAARRAAAVAAQASGKK
jgi:2,3-bisphosphoglycerate-dependent phosphoglycerate mutase